MILASRETASKARARATHRASASFRRRRDWCSSTTATARFTRMTLRPARRSGNGSWARRPPAQRRRAAAARRHKRSGRTAISWPECTAGRRKAAKLPQRRIPQRAAELHGHHGCQRRHEIELASIVGRSRIPPAHCLCERGQFGTGTHHGSGA